MDKVLEQIKSRQDEAFKFGWQARFVDVMQELKSKSKATKRDDPVLCIVEEYSKETKPLKANWFYWY